VGGVERSAKARRSRGQCWRVFGTIYAVCRCFASPGHRMLSNMSQTANPPPLNWSDLGMSALVPTGTVTLLLADVEGSTRLWGNRARRDDRGDRAPAERG